MATGRVVIACDQCDKALGNWRYQCFDCGDWLHWRCVTAHNSMCEECGADDEENRMLDEIILSLS
jgi:hypothetical protein